MCGWAHRTEMEGVLYVPRKLKEAKRRRTEKIQGSGDSPRLCSKQSTALKDELQHLKTLGQLHKMKQPLQNSQERAGQKHAPKD